MKIQIINSKGHWLNGWATQPSSLKIVLHLLQKAGFQVNSIEVTSLSELHKVLVKTPSNTLVWANAYWVNGTKGELHGIIETIEKYNLPLIGSNLKTLLQLLEKDTCQLKLKAAGIPVPSFITVRLQEIENIENLITESGLEFPLVLKPTNESRSMGVTLVNNLAEATMAAKKISQHFAHGNLIVEEFLASDDITCGFLRMGKQEMILPSYNVVKGMDCKTEVFSEYHYTLPSHFEKQVCIEDASTLSQLKTYLPTIVKLFDIQTTTRVDGRLDRNGTMNFFDINGLPGLNFPISALVKQCFTHFPNYERTYLFESLIHTIIADSLLRYNMPVLSSVREQNLFNLDSSTILKAE